MKKNKFMTAICVLSTFVGANLQVKETKLKKLVIPIVLIKIQLLKKALQQHIIQESTAFHQKTQALFSKLKWQN